MANETCDKWFAACTGSPTGSRFRELVNNFTVLIDVGPAFVRTDGSFFVEDKLRSDKVD